jgi:hypothetical protein
MWLSNFEKDLKGIFLKQVKYYHKVNTVSRENRTEVALIADDYCIAFENISELWININRFPTRILLSEFAFHLTFSFDNAKFSVAYLLFSIKGEL